MIYQLKISTVVNNKLIGAYTVFRRKKNHASVNLVEIGRLEKPKTDINERYKPGQLFIHKLFAYRGIILFPWFARVLDQNTSEVDILELMKQKRSRYNSTSYYYQVLVDLRDRSFLSNFTHFEAVTYLGSNNFQSGLRSLPGMDYVAHEDVIPFMPTASYSVQHELLDNFFTQNSGTELGFSSNKALKVWEKKNTSWLELSQVYKQTSDGVRVTAIPFYIGYQKTKHKNSLKYWWRYHIRLENYSKFQMQLQYHYWRIADSYGSTESVHGPGVVGLAPFLCRRYPVFQYNSHVSLNTPNGHMYGTYILEKENGKRITCNIPIFVLESKKYDETLSSNLYL